MDLDIAQLRAFVAVAEGRSFTGAGKRLGAGQSAVSLRVRKLEERLGATLLSRTPRKVALTPFGARFLPEAKTALAAHDRAAALAQAEPKRREIRLGVSDHAVGDRLAEALAWLIAATPEAAWRVRVGDSAGLAEALAAGALDIAVLRRPIGAAAPEETLFEDALEWIARPDAALARPTPERPLPLIALAGACAVRDAATTALESAGIPWREVLLAEGVAAVQAAVRAGIGVACLDRRNRPVGAVPVGPALGLPTPPASAMTLRSRLADAGARPIVAAVRAAFSQG